NKGTMTISASTFGNNTAGLAGGGIYAYDISHITIIDSYFGFNTGSSDAGIHNEGVLTIANSTFYHNTSAHSGGGVPNNRTLTITNSTFADNSAANNGGGVYNGTGDTLTIINSTFSGNAAPSGGGGVFNAGSATIHNSIIANSPSGGNCSGTITGSSSVSSD